MGEADRDLLDVVGDEHRGRRRRIGGQIGESGDEVFAPGEVEPGGRLVEQQEAGSGMRVRASSTRWRSPEDNVAKLRSARCPMPSCSRQARARSRSAAS